MAMISLSGSCEIKIVNKKDTQFFNLDKPDKCLLVEPGDWHEMAKYESTTTLLVLASEKYDIDDYFYEKPA